MATNLLVTILGIPWTIIIYCCLWGYGSALCKEKSLPTWVYPIIGIAVYTTIGGWLDYLKIGHLPTLITLLLPGGFLFLKELELKPIASLKLSKLSLKSWSILLLGILLISYKFLGALNYDDTLGYFPPCKELAYHGSSFGEFSLRRALTLGGEFPLQTLGMSIGNEGGYLYDVSLGTLILLFFSLEIAKKEAGFAPAIIILCLPAISNNSAPAQLITILLIGAFFTKRGFLQNMLLATSIAMRTQSIIFVTIIILYQCFLENKKPETLKEKINYLLASGATILTLLLPFLLNELRQFHTICPVLYHGTINPRYIDLKGDLLDNIIGLKALIITHPGELTLLSLGLLNRKSQPFALGALITTVIIMIVTQKLELGYWGRYSWPYLCAGIIITFWIILKENKTRWELLLVLSTLCIPVPLSYAIRLISGESKYSCSTIETYNNTFQTQLAPEKTIAILSAGIENMDFKRNKIVNLDVFTAMNNIPHTSNLEEWEKWGKTNKVDYLAIMDFDQIIEKEQGKTYTVKDLLLGRGSSKANLAFKHYQEIWIPDRITFFSIIEELKKKAHAEKKGTFYLINLNTN